MQTCYFSGGRFLHLYRIFYKIHGIVQLQAGYLNSVRKNPTIQLVNSGLTNAVECLQVQYNSQEITYEELINIFIKQINVFQLNCQGSDVGTQYRAGIYHNDSKHKQIANGILSTMQFNCKEKIQVDVCSIANFYVAEDQFQLNKMEKQLIS
ncbi:Peptide_methionine sulfoxide reductase MsrA [Hexamita inflata]|uniref:peptide-methionine (S)-S-oxide reductase n=1 Tax=Hexamita inflata TaxID=28002 RepID=A0AA86UZV2_9EUKA|nr:Peptide methionine sulfoxide reductase MsrA [Hexamita inflata]